MTLLITPASLCLQWQREMKDKFRENFEVTAKRLRKDYYLYVVFHWAPACRQAAQAPTLNILQDPGTLDWQPIVKVEHYRLRQDSIRHPVEPKEDPSPYRTSP